MHPAPTSLPYLHVLDHSEGPSAGQVQPPSTSKTDVAATNDQTMVHGRGQPARLTTVLIACHVITVRKLLKVVLPLYAMPSSELVAVILLYHVASPVCSLRPCIPTFKDTETRWQSLAFAAVISTVPTYLCTLCRVSPTGPYSTTTQTPRSEIQALPKCPS